LNKSKIGSRLSRYISSVRRRNERRVLLVGIDGAGKTSLVKYYKSRGASSSSFSTSTSNDSSAVSTSSSPSPRDFDVHSIKIPAKKSRSALVFQVWDIGGQDSVRPYWRHYYTGTQGVIFVIDASEKGQARLGDVVGELSAMASDEQLADCSILILGNRCDAPGSFSAERLQSQLGLDNLLSKHTWRITMCDTLTGKGLDDGLDFLGDTMREL
jgi:small GTP-binding protein